MKKTLTSTTTANRPGPLLAYQQGTTLVAKRSRPNVNGDSPTDLGTVLRCLVGGISPPQIRTASEGIYYIIRTPKAWQLFIYPYVAGQPQIHHVEFWKAQVAPYVAHAWARAFAQPDYQKSIATRLETQLHDLYYAFPRGRIDRGNGTVFIVRNGNNMKRNMPSKVQIEQAFEIKGVCEWEFDSHEQCMDEDAHAIRDILKLKDLWKSVDPQE